MTGGSTNHQADRPNLSAIRADEISHFALIHHLSECHTLYSLAWVGCMRMHNLSQISAYLSKHQSKAAKVGGELKEPQGNRGQD